MAVANGSAIHANGIATRPLILPLGQIRVSSTFFLWSSICVLTRLICKVSIPVSTQSDEWIAAEVLREEFIHKQSLLDTVDTTAQLENEQDAAVELSALFLGHVAASLHKDPQSAPARTALLLNLLKHFTSSYLATKDIHSLAASYDTETRKAVISAYVSAVAALQQRDITFPRQPESALLNAASLNKASIFALFGGQGTNEVYFDELQSLYDVYRPFVASFLKTVTEDVLVPLATEHEAFSFYTFGLDVVSWLSGETPRPSVAYLASVPVSLPLIGLTQLVQYLVVCHVSGLSPGEFRSRIAGATGHSQGIVAAVAIAASATFEEFTNNSVKALKWLFFCGLRGQHAFPVTSVEPSIVQDATEGGEGTPSPMLSVTGLGLKELQPHITKTNKHLPENSQLFVSLHNGPKAFVVTGPPKALFGLVTSLRKVKAPSGLDQSKTPFSQRKPVFSIRFLVVGVPYHSDYLKGATEKLLLEDLGGKELWEAKDLKISVFNTEDGTLHDFACQRFFH